mgnify:CR=1 FL=1
MLEAGLNRVKTMPIDSLPNDSLVYPIEERQGDFVSDPSNNPFDLNDPSLIEQNVEYDPKTGTYIITETIGGEYYKPPTYLTFDEFWKLQQQDIQQNYWEEKAGSQSLLQIGGAHV